jgi:hypothetical protein
VSDQPNRDEPEQMTPAGHRIPARMGYVLGEDQRVEDILAVDAELLRSEGIDPTWPGFSEQV